MKRLCLAFLLFGLSLFAGGAGMRVYAQIDLYNTQQRLLAARPASSADVTSAASTFESADSSPSRIDLPAAGLWNALEPVDQQAEWQGDQMGMAWGVADAGWHIHSGWPGWGGNVVIAGHSPSRDPRTWAHSIFRQLAYLANGDHIEVTAGKRVYVYAVSNVFAVPGSDAQTPNAIAWLDRGHAEHLTLITCWPPRTAAYRVVVIAQPVSTYLVTEH